VAQPKSILEYWILKLLDSRTEPQGAGSLLEILEDQGLSVSEAGVGRAMRALRNQGFLEKRGKQGHCITLSGKERLRKIEEEKELRDFLKDVVVQPGMRGGNNLIERLVARKAIEREAVYQATLNATEEDFAAIERIVADQYENMKKNENYVDMSAQFHRAILKASRVPLLETLYDFIGISSKWQNFFVGTFKVYNTPLNVSHDKILRLMKARDPEKAAEAMASHLEDVIANAKKLSPEDH
jgi:GntR family L-lactate dehydrogenase operon transcriptional regulator